MTRDPIREWAEAERIAEERDVAGPSDASAWLNGAYIDDGSDKLRTLPVKETCFHIGQSYEGHPASQVVCAECGGDTFHVGGGYYYTAVKCTGCGMEQCVHTG